jgi:hypothetical protein
MMRFNGDDATSYSIHLLEGYGSGTPTSSASVSSTQIKVGLSPTADTAADRFGSFVTDVLDYASTTKGKTTRSLYGDDLNGSGTVGFASGGWYQISGIGGGAANVTSITIYPTNAMNFVNGCQFALYGVK